MVSRMIMSLKKAATSQPPQMSIELQTGLPTDSHDTYTPDAASGDRLFVVRN